MQDFDITQNQNQLAVLHLLWLLLKMAQNNLYLTVANSKIPSLTIAELILHKQKDHALCKNHHAAFYNMMDWCHLATISYKENHYQTSTHSMNLLLLSFRTLAAKLPLLMPNPGLFIIWHFLRALKMARMHHYITFGHHLRIYKTLGKHVIRQQKEKDQTKQPL